MVAGDVGRVLFGDSAVVLKKGKEQVVWSQMSEEGKAEKFGKKAWLEVLA